MKLIEENIMSTIKLVDNIKDDYKNESNIKILETVKNNLLSALGGLQLLNSEEEKKC